MGRTVSLSREECEAALGPRGKLVVGAHNHVTVRKWLVARGIPSSVAYAQTFRQLACLYNRPDDWDQQPGSLGSKYCFNVLQAEVANKSKEAPKTDEPEQLGDILNKLTKAIQPQIDIAEIIETVTAAIREEYGKPTVIELRRPEQQEPIRIEGAHKTFPTLLRAMASRQSDGYHPNILLVGPTGSGKTHAVREAAKHLGLEFFTNGAISMDYQLIGFRDAAGNYHETPFRQAFDKPAVYLFDEIDSSDNSPLLALAGALANGHFAFPDATVSRHPDSVIIAAGNTWGHGATADFVGRNKLDAAIRSRFPIRIHWDYDEALEANICGNPEWAKHVQTVRAKARKAGLKIVIDPRITIAGAALIAAGCSLQEAAELTYLADLSDDQRKMLEG